MTVTLENTIFIITSREEKNKSFGTGFIIKRDENASYLLTCAHVVKKVGGQDKVQVGTLPAEVVVDGSPMDIDLAILKVDGLVKDALPLRVLDDCKVPFSSRGFREFDTNTTPFAARTLEGQLGDKIDLVTKTYTNIEAWDLHIEKENDLAKNDFANLAPGYSGSPVCDKDGKVFAVVTHSLSNGKQGYAISIVHLEQIYPELFSELLGSQSQLISTTPPTQGDYKYDIFLSYVDDEMTQKWVEKTFMPIFRHFLKVHFKKKEEPQITFATHQKEGDLDGDFVSSWKKLAYSRCVIPICSFSYFDARSSQMICETMHFRKKQTRPTPDNPRLLLPVVTAYRQLEKFKHFFNCVSYQTVAKGYHDTPRGIEFQQEMAEWIETYVINSIEYAPPWKPQWLEKPPSETNICKEEQPGKIPLPKMGG